MLFKVQVLDGKGFGQDTQALLCCASFAGATKTTQYSVATHEHIWNSTLTWSVSKEDLRSATNNTNHCKISVLRRDGVSLGWVVISLRSAKLQGRYRSDPEGLRLQLNASKLPEPPQLRVTYSLLDERPQPSARQRRSPVILQHSDSCSSLGSASSKEFSGSECNASGAAPATDEHCVAHTATAGSGHADNTGQGSQPARGGPRDRRLAAASLRPSRAASMAAGAASNAAAGSSTGAGGPAATADLGTIAVREVGDAPGVSGVAAVDAPLADMASSAAGGSDQMSKQQQPVDLGSSHDASGQQQSACSGCAGHDPPAAAAAHVQQLEPTSLQPQQKPASGLDAAMERSAQEPPAGNDMQLAAAGGAADSSGGGQTEPVQQQTGANAAECVVLAAAEERLPSFTRMRQQQQERGELSLLLQQQQSSWQSTPSMPAESLPLAAAAAAAAAALAEPASTDAQAAESAQQELGTPAGFSGVSTEATAETGQTQQQGTAGQMPQPQAWAGHAADMLTEPTEGTATVASAAAAAAAAAASTLPISQGATGITSSELCGVAVEPTDMGPDTSAASSTAGLPASCGAAAKQTAVQPSAAPAAPAAPAPAAAAAAGPRAADRAAEAAPAAARTVDGPPGAGAALPDPTRSFVLTVDVRSFQAGRRLPVALGSVYVTAWLPQELLGFLATHCHVKLPARLTPLKTKPAVDIPRGSEVRIIAWQGALPGGTMSVPFACGVMALAGLLAAEPRVTLEVWHKERLRSDLLLGIASLPLSALLQECWVDGYAPCYALMARASGSSSTQQPGADEEKVQVGLLRVVLSLEERGPAEPRVADPAPAGVSASGLHALSRSPPAAASTAAAAATDNQEQQQQAQQKHSGAQHPASPDATDALQQQPAAHGVSLESRGFRQMPEYLVAWELEVWRKAEEARFRAQLQELEQSRMGVIEAAWRAREAQRQADIAAMKAKYAALEKQTRELLTATQDRERTLLAVEAELRLRKDELERQAAARMTEAEAAVRRLQVECEHQLGLERDRTAAALKQRDSAESRAAALEAQFAEYVAAQRSAPETQLKAELAQAQSTVKSLDAKLQAALKVKDKYKQQVQQLAREVAVLHHKQQQDVIMQQQQQLAAALARERDTADAAQLAQLAALRDELAKLKTAAFTADPAAFRVSEPHLQHGVVQEEAAGSPSFSSCSSKDGRRARHQRSRHKAAAWEDKENQCWHPDDGHQPCHRQHAHGPTDGHARKQQRGPPWQQQQQQRQPRRQPVPQPQQHPSGYSSDDAASDRGSGSSSDYGSRLAAEASAREVAAEGASLASLLNPPRLSNAQQLAGQQHSADDPATIKAQAQQPELTGSSQQPRNSYHLHQQQQQHTEPATAGDGGGSAPSGRGVQEGHGSSSSSPLREVRRLLREKAELLATGLYEPADAVISQIDARVQQLAELAAEG